MHASAVLHGRRVSMSWPDGRSRWPAWVSAFAGHLGLSRAPLPLCTMQKVRLVNEGAQHYMPTFISRDQSQLHI